MSEICVAWITLKSDDEQELLLRWDADSDSFGLIAAPWHSDQSPAEGLKARLRMEMFQSANQMQVGTRPLARLDGGAITSTLLESARRVSVYPVSWRTADLPNFDAGYRWTSRKEVQVGITHDGKSIDPMLRQILELTGRSVCRFPADPTELYVGVTGHRDLNAMDLAVTRDKVHQALDDLSREFPRQTVVLLSSLAEGADQLAADVARERDFDLIVPLPLPLDLYEDDFPTSAVVDEFREHLDGARHWFSLPLPPTITRDQAAVGGHSRNLCYRAAGEFVVDHGDVLLTLWDGRVGRGTGGTADVLRYALERPRPASRRFFIRHVPVRRTTY